MLLVLATLGFTSIIGQVVLMRELVVVNYGNELIFGLILAWWLLWEAIGAWGLGRWASRRHWRQRALALTLVLAAFALPFEIILTRSIRDLLGVTPGAILPLGQVFWIVGLILAPYCLVHGLSFSLGVRLLAGDSAGQAYAYESAGAVVGGALFSFVLIDRIDPFQAILVATGLTLIVVAQLAWPVTRRWSRLLPLIFITVLAALPLGAWLHRGTLAQQWPRLIYADDSPYGRLTITALGGQRAFYENGLLAFETESTFPEEVVHLPMLVHPHPDRVLLIGGGVAGDLTELFKYDVTKVTYLELDSQVIRAAQLHLPAGQAAVLKDPRLTLIYQDGRYYAKHGRELFDVVIVDLPEPSTGQLNRYYTLEFFQEVKSILTKEGILSLGLPSAENYWNPELARRNASVYHTLRQVFPTVLVTPGDHNFFLATTVNSLPGPSVLGERLQMRDIATRWVMPEYIQFLLTGDRFKTILTNLEAADDVKLNRDLTPICYFYDLALWVSRFGSGLRGAFEATSLLRLGWLALSLVIGLLALWGRRQAIGLALVASTGFAGMTLQIVLLLAFQARYGYIYRQVGILVTAFMGGLTLGAGVMTGRRLVATDRWLLGIQVGIVLFALATALTLPLGLPAPAFSFPLLAAIAGVLTGVIFPLVAMRCAPDRQSSRVAGLLYGADLIGGCIGAVATSVVLVPVLGVVQTNLAIALIASAGGVLSLYPSFTDHC